MPTVFRYGSYRFHFFSREETRRHIHISCPDGEVKVWIEPEISVADVAGLSSHQINEILDLVHNRKEEIIEHWNSHFNQN